MQNTSHVTSKGRSDWNGGLSQSELASMQKQQVSSLRMPEKILWTNTRIMNLAGKSPALQLAAIQKALKINIEGMDSSGKSRNDIINDCIDVIKEQLNPRELVALSAWAIVEGNVLKGELQEVMNGLSAKK